VAAALASYELILMIDPRLGDEQRGSVAADAKSRLEAKGTVTKESVWGMRKMAYEIELRGEADYRCYRFEGENDLLEDLNHALRIADGVLRFRVFKVDAEAPMIEPPDTEQIMRRDEDDDRGRGRGRRDDRGPRRSQDDGDRGPTETPAAPAETPAPPAEAPAPTAEPAAEPPAEPAAEAPAAPAEPAAEPAPAVAPAEGDGTPQT
jgi:small subunit ribosomal protein S6